MDVWEQLASKLLKNVEKWANQTVELGELCAYLDMVHRRAQAEHPGQRFSITATQGKHTYIFTGARQVHPGEFHKCSIDDKIRKATHGHYCTAWHRLEKPPQGARAQMPPQGFPPSPITAALQTLELSAEGLTPEAVRDRRRQLMRQFHPDRPGGSVEKSQAINEAADILLARLK